MIPRKINLKTPRQNSAPPVIFDAGQVLIDHASRSLPDSLHRRRLVLQAIKVKINPEHPAHLQVCAQIAALDSISELQSRLQDELDRSLNLSSGLSSWKSYH